MIVVGLTGGIGAGKSTVSTMLAARGAAIVDADQIARDLQSPGSTVLAAMADRFGSYILSDEDGSLDRGAVAKIVFSDKEALDDLNGIVHPAMQAEIQRQIDVHRQSDRLVVLDFPLLGENPRKGLAATVVVDVPYELAVRRIVEMRGMEEQDAQNRIDSQITREKRLETATHVIDNTGDLVDLEAQVDRLWSQLLKLPSTSASDLAEPAETTPSETAPTETTWVFGYGSLVSPTSLERTIERLAQPGVDFFTASLSGYGRRWNYGVGSIVASWKLDDGTDIAEGTIVALGLERSASELVNGIVARVSADELAALDLRERDYDSVDVTEQVSISADVEGRVVTYVPRRMAVERYEVARDSNRAGVRRKYWDLVDAAFEELGADQAEIYRASTPAPDVPIVTIGETEQR